MADIKVELKNSLNSKIYPKTTLDNIVKSVASSTTLITSGGVIKKDFLDLTGLISANYVSSANVIPTSAISGLSTAITNGASSYVNSSSVVPVSAIINFNSAVSSAISSSLQPEISAGFGINITGGSTISLARTRPITTIPSTSTSVTLQPGEAYIIDATTTSKTLNVGSVPSGHFGLESHMEIFVANTGYIVTGTNVVLTQPLEPDSVNNCTIRFHDGFAIISVEDYVAGYIVVSSGSASNTSGTLAYGLTSASSNYIAFDGRLNGSVIPFGGVTANGKKHVVGNGYDNTILTGSVNCGASKFTVANLSLQDIIVNGGTLTLGDVYIPSGGTVSVSGGGLAIERVIGGGTIDLNNTTVIVPKKENALVSSCTIINGSGGNGGAFVLNSSSYVRLDHVTASNCLATQGALARLTGGAATLELNSCSVTGCTATYGGGIAIAAYTAQVSMSNSVVSGNKTPLNFPTDVNIFGGTMYVNGGNTVGIIVIRSPASAPARVELRESNAIRAVTNFGSGFSASVTISSGAIVDLTSSTETNAIMPGGGITFEPGGATVKVGGSTASSSYMMDNVALPAGAKLTNTNVVDLGGTHIISLDTITGCTLTGGRTYPPGGTVIGRGGAVLFGSSGTLTDCTISGNVAQQGGGVCVQLNQAVCTCSNCTITGNTPDDVRVAAGKIVLSGGTYGVCTANNGAIEVAGTTRIGSVAGNSIGSVTLASGAILDLTGNTKAIPISTRGAITIPADAIVNIIGSDGTTSAYLSELALTGTTITNAPAVLGATVTVPATGGPWEVYFADHTTSTYSATGTQRQVVLTGAVTYVGGL